MSQTRINAAKEQQIELKAQQEEIKVTIESEKLSQVLHQLTIQQIKTSITELEIDTTQLQLNQAEVSNQQEMVKLGAMQDNLSFITAERSLKQSEYRLKLEAGSINLAQLMESNRHTQALSGVVPQALPSIDLDK